MGDLSNILNWRRISDRISTSGQPSEDELSQIRDGGVTHILNLGPHSNKGALVDEPGTVTRLGMHYLYLPVDFDNPTEADFDKFCELLEEAKSHRIHVHCIYNARVSAFFYRYAKTGKGGMEHEMYKIMDSIWRPGGVWAVFIGDSGSTGKPNRYAGEDY